jgi:molecular chaperone GrpE
MRIPVNNKANQSQEHSASEAFDQTHAGVAAVAADMAGPAGADVTGGDVTPPQEADAASERHNRTRTDNEDMEQRQMGGEVETQREDMNPSAAQPGRSQTDDARAGENAAGGSGAATEDVAAQLEQTKAQLLHLAADFDNYKKLAARREAEVRERAARGVLEDFLPVLDNFERAVESTRNARDVEAVRVGVEYILKQFQEVLAAHGIEAIPAQGEPFDPLRHDALERVASSEHPAGTVVAETQRGYTHRGEVLRPSRVQVAG